MEPKNQGFSLLLMGLALTLLCCILFLPLPGPTRYTHPLHPVRWNKEPSVVWIDRGQEDILTRLLRDLREWRPPSLLGGD